MPVNLSMSLEAAALVRLALTRGSRLYHEGSFAKRLLERTLDDLDLATLEEQKRVTSQVTPKKEVDCTSHEREQLDAPIPPEHLTKEQPCLDPSPTPTSVPGSPALPPGKDASS